MKILSHFRSRCIMGGVLVWRKWRPFRICLHQLRKTFGFITLNRFRYLHINRNRVRDHCVWLFPISISQNFQEHVILLGKLSSGQIYCTLLGVPLQATQILTKISMLCYNVYQLSYFPRCDSISCCMSLFYVTHVFSVPDVISSVTKTMHFFPLTGDSQKS